MVKPLGKKSVNAGRSILEILWEELDSIMDRLMEDGEPNWYDSKFKSDGYLEDLDAEGFKTACKEWGEERGQAQGMAYAIAVMTNPYLPNVPLVKQIAMERYQERQEES